MTLADAVFALRPAARPLADYRVEDDGTGSRIAFWSPALGPQPTAAELAAVTEQQVQDARDALAPERSDLRRQAAAAVNAIDLYLATADTATAAEVRAQVKRLSQYVRRVIVRLVQID